MEAKSIDDTFKILLSQNLSLNSEILPLLSALNRILAQDIYAKRNLPPFDNSAMDGYAFNLSDAGKCVEIVDTIFAGDNKAVEIKAGQCVKIMTGARIPAGADCVVPFEEISGGFDNVGEILAPSDLREFANIKINGEEVKKGELLFKKGSVLNAESLALLSSQGISSVRVFMPLKIAVFASGNELKEPWEVAKEGEIYNSNATMVQAILQEAHFKSIYGGILRDNLDSIKESLSGNFDVIITTGGASKGEADFMRKALSELGTKILIPSVLIKPGKPIMVAKLQDKFIIALPGNPLAGGVTLRALILPFLKKLSGFAFKDSSVNYFSVKITHSFKRKPRPEMILGNLSENGVTLINNGKYGSAQIKPLVCANVLVLLNEESEIEEGDLVKIMPFVWRG